MIERLPDDLVEHVYRFVHAEKMPALLREITGFRKSRLNARGVGGRRFRWVALLTQVKQFEDALAGVIEERWDLAAAGGDWTRVLADYTNIPDAVYRKCCGRDYGPGVVAHVRDRGTLPPALRKYLVYDRRPREQNGSFIRSSEERRRYVHRFGVRCWATPRGRRGFTQSDAAAAAWSRHYAGDDAESCELCDLAMGIWWVLDIELDLVKRRRQRPGCGLEFAEVGE